MLPSPTLLDIWSDQLPKQRRVQFSTRAQSYLHCGNLFCTFSSGPARSAAHVRLKKNERKMSLRLLLRCFRSIFALRRPHFQFFCPLDSLPIRFFFKLAFRQELGDWWISLSMLWLSLNIWILTYPFVNCILTICILFHFATQASVRVCVRCPSREFFTFPTERDVTPEQRIRKLFFSALSFYLFNVAP